MLRTLWQRDDVAWARRMPGAGWLSWDMATSPVPAGFPDMRGGVILCLAGAVPAPGADMAVNLRVALAACAAGRDLGARHVFLASSAAIYGPATLSAPPLDELATPHPASDYGAAKLEAERAVERWQAEHPGIGVTHLRIGNVAGADALLGRPLDAPRRIDPVAGSAAGPVRSYIGPQGFARVLAGLCDLALAGGEIPPALNIAATGPVCMGDLLTAAGVAWTHGPVNPAVVPAVELATARLERLLPGCAGPGDAAAIVADWQGWRARA